MRKRAMGWTRDRRDERDFEYRPLKLMVTPQKADLSPRMKFPIFDQGNLGSCTAQALATICLYNDIYDYDVPIVSPSRLFIYYNERRMEGTIGEDAGAMLRTGIKALAKWGYPPEKLWPYKITKFKDKPTDIAYSDALTERISSYARLRTINDFKFCIAEGFPFVFGFYCYSSMFTAKASSTGIIPMPTRRDVEQGGHAVTACGYDDEKKWFIFRNSWSKNWGKNGYGFLPYDYMADGDLAMDQWTIRFNRS